VLPAVDCHPAPSWSPARPESTELVTGDHGGHRLWANGWLWTGRWWPRAGSMTS